MFKFSTSSPTTKVSVDIDSSQVWEKASSVDIATCDRDSQPTAISVDRELEYCSRGCNGREDTDRRTSQYYYIHYLEAQELEGSRSAVGTDKLWNREMLQLTGELVALTPPETLVTLVSSPSIVASNFNDVNLFKLVLTHVATKDTPPSVASFPVSPVHRAPPRIAQAVSIDLWPCVGLSNKWIVRRCGIRCTLSGVASINIDTQYGAQECAPAKTRQREITLPPILVHVLIFLTCSVRFQWCQMGPHPLHRRQEQ